MPSTTEDTLSVRDLSEPSQTDAAHEVGHIANRLISQTMNLINYNGTSQKGGSSLQHIHQDLPNMSAISAQATF